MKSGLGVIKVVLLLSIYGFCSYVQARGYALSVTMQDLKDPYFELYTLPQTEKDLHLFLELCDVWKVPANHRISLENEQATRANIISALNLLAGMVQPNDFVVFYFSGHGFQVPDLDNDEDDEMDELLVPYDTRPVAGAYENVLLDDQLNQYFAAINTKNILVLVDACNSGTVAKSPRWMFEKTKTRKTHNKDRSQHFVSLTACADNQLAWAPSDETTGSFFTMEVHARIMTAHRMQQTLTFQNLLRDIRPKLEANRNPQTPQIDGNHKRYDALIYPYPFAGDRVPEPRPDRDLKVRNYQAPSKPVKSEKTNTLSIDTDKPLYAEGQNLGLEISLPFAGYFNLFAMDDQDRASLLYPSHQYPDNYLSAGAVNQEQFPLRFRAEKAGNTWLIALHYPNPVNLFSNPILAEKISRELESRSAEELRRMRGNEHVASDTVLVPIEPAR